MNKFLNFFTNTVSASLLITFSAPAFAEDGPGVTKDNVLICSYQPMTGKVSSYFRMGKGADAWFQHVNENGGINGRKIEFKMVDDKYEPARTKTAVKRFVERDDCFAIVAPLGSAPTSAVIDYIVSKNVPLIGAGTGAEKNLTIDSKWVFPLYPSYHTEGQQLVQFTKEVFKANKVAVLYQNDPSGKTHMAGIESVLEEQGIEIVAHEGYEPKEVDVSSQVIAMKASGADAVICSCAPEPAAKFYTERAKLGWDVPVVNVFFGKSPKVAELAGNDAVNGVYFSTIFRDFDSPAPQIQKAKQILTKYYPEEQPDAIHLWGFAGSQVFTEALRRMGDGPITRDLLVKTMEGIDDWKDSVVPNITIGEGTAKDHFIIKDMSFVRFNDGKFDDFTPPWMK
ncbi:MAG: ABC transporter substrate-binding protein [Paracoccaceae bacterium]|nr:ABC transporter substrate-binding protein [Paracoccaceae bacterium]